MNIKKYIINISLIVVVSFLFSQNLNEFTQKISLENSLRDKIYSEIGRVIDKDRFVIVVNLQLGRYGDLVIKNQSNDKKNYNSRGMEYLPGVPLSGSKGLSGKNIPSRRTSVNDYVISEIDIAVYIEQSLATGSNEKIIESLIKDIVPQTAQCEDCITIETMSFQTQSSEDTEIDKLRKELESLKEKARQDQLTELNIKLADLQAKLTDSETDRMTWEDYQRQQDSLKLAKFEEEKAFEDALMKEQLVLAQNKLDTVINERIQSETQTKNDLIDIISGKSKRDDDFLGLQVPRTSSSNTMIILGIVLIIIIVIAILIFNKKQTVYLKPKDDSTESASTNSSENNSSNNTASSEDETGNNNSNNNANPGSTSANQDEGVVVSEVKALRQSAIALSAAQKEGANQIIKDWIDDANSQNKEQKEENNTSENEGGE